MNLVNQRNYFDFFENNYTLKHPLLLENKLPVEVLKLIDDDNMVLLQTILNKIYDFGCFHEKLLRSTFIQLPKKVNAYRCNDNRVISLMNHNLN